MKPTNAIERRPGETTAQLYKRVSRGKSKWNAKPTKVDGIRFDSKVEAHVYERLVRQYGKSRVYRQVRFPLLSIAPDSRRRPLYMTVDFVVKLQRFGIDAIDDMEVIDAKSGKRRSREWARGKAAFESTYGVQIMEVSE